MSEKVYFLVDRHDSDGDVSEVGIYLLFGDCQIKIGETMADFDNLVEQLNEMRPELADAVDQRRKPR